MEWFELKHRPQSRCGPKGSNERNVKLKRVVDFGAPRAAGRTILTHTGVGRTILTETQGAEFTMVRPALGKTGHKLHAFPSRRETAPNETKRGGKVL